MRKLVTLRTVASVNPIPDADMIEVARIDGWDVVVKKGEFAPGDPCVYFEIDSYLPIDGRYEFLRKSSYRKIAETGQEGFRLKTVRLRGQISQGLALPLSAFPEFHSLPHGSDVTEILKVEKFELPLPACLSGEVHGRKSSAVPTTDQERIQNMFDALKNDAASHGMVYEATVKLDGTSMSMYLDPENGEFRVCGRNYAMKDNPGSSYWQAAKKYPFEDILRNGGVVTADQQPIETVNLALQGELVGPGIQENNERLKKVQFFLFDVYDIRTARYLTPLERTEFARFFGIAHVPFEGAYTGEKLFAGSVDDILAMADGPSMNKERRREGLVFKRQDGKVSFKAISNEYLLKNGE
jgi:RNA ligase (TIGR02306 family)